MLPGSALAAVLVDDAPLLPVAADVLARWGPDPLRAVGVLAEPAVLRLYDVALDPDGELGDLDAADAWAEAVLDRLPDASEPPVLRELVAVRDLELVRSDAWSAALRLIPPEALRPAAVLLAGRQVQVPSYTAWWLGREPVLDGHRPVDVLLPGGDERLVGLYEPLPAGADEDLARVLGAVRELALLLADPDGTADLLRRLADPSRSVPRRALPSLTAEVAAAVLRWDLPVPDRVRAVHRGEVVVAPAADAVLVDRPDLLPLTGGRPVVPAPLSAVTQVAEAFDLALLSELVELPGGHVGVGRRLAHRDPLPTVDRAPPRA